MSDRNNLEARMDAASAERGIPLRPLQEYPAAPKANVKNADEVVRPLRGDGRFEVYKDKSSQSRASVGNVLTLLDKTSGAKYTVSVVTNATDEHRGAELAQLQAAVALFLETIHDAL